MVTAESPKEAARRLSASALADGFKPEALHVYRDAAGEPLFYKIRAKHPDGEKWIRPMKRNGRGYELKEPDFERGKPLYNWDRIVGSAGASAPVWIVEGEKAADALTAIGVVATTSGGTQSAPKADWSPLWARSCVIWPDNDGPGKEYGCEVSKILEQLGCPVATIDVGQLAIPEKGDAADWAAAHADATPADLDALPRLAGLPQVHGDDAKRAIAHAVVAPHVPTPCEPATAAATAPKEADGDAVERLAALPPLDYDRVRKPEADRLRVRVDTLDRQVAARREAQREEQGMDGMFPAIHPWPGAVDPRELLADLHHTILTYVVCGRETAVAIVLWIAFTWFIDWVQVAPIALITAPEKRCGKTTLLNLFGRLVRRALMASNISPAATFRVIEAHSPTLLLDEADAFLRENEEMRGVINSGHTRDSAYVIRTVGDDHDPQQFSTWGAKAIAGIGRLAETIVDRAIVLELRRKLPSESVERLRHADPAVFDQLASKLARFAVDAGAAVERARPALPEALNDRAQDNWEPLLAIADHAGGDWPKLARTAALTLSGAEQEAVSLSAELLADIRCVFEAQSVDRISTAELLKALTDDDLKPWATYNKGKAISARQLAKRLEEYHVKSKNLKYGYADVRKGFTIEQFADAFARYLSPPGTPSGVATALPIDESPMDTRASVVADSERGSATENNAATGNPAITLESSVVADKEGGAGGGQVEVEI